MHKPSLRIVNFVPCDEKNDLNPHFKNGPSTDLKMSTNISLRHMIRVYSKYSTGMGSGPITYSLLHTTLLYLVSCPIGGIHALYFVQSWGALEVLLFVQ